MDGTRKVLDESYVVYYKDSNGEPKYVTTIYRTSISSDSDINDAMRLKTKEEVKSLKLLASRVAPNYNYYVRHVSTIVEDLDDKELNSETE